MDKNEVLEFLRANPACHLATIEDNAPRVRAIGIYKVKEDGIYIQTFKSKDMYKQMISNPQVELCFNNFDDGLQVRVRGSVEPVEDEQSKKQAMEDRPFLKQFVDQGEEVAIFRLQNGLAHTWTMATNFDPKSFIQL